MEQPLTHYFLSKNVSALRRQHSLTQAQMAAIMGISIHSLRQLERGRVTDRVRGTAVRRLCEYFHLRSDDILGITQMPGNRSENP